jgi:hypothetical protein
MDIAQIKERLAAIERLISGVTRAEAHAPSSLPETDLPMFLNFVGQASHDQERLGENLDYISREFRAVLYVTPISSGISQEAEARVEPFIDACSKVFLAHPALTSPTYPSPASWVQRARLSSDSGVTIVRFSEGSSVQRFLGIEFRIRVEGQSWFEYTEGE